MAHLFRNTALGTVIRLATRNARLAFPGDGDRYPTRMTAEVPCAQVNSPLELTAEERDTDGCVVVSWNSEVDPENPQNWPTARKTLVATLICMYTFTVYCGSSIYVPSEENVMKEFNVSTTSASLGLALYVLGYGLGPLLFSPLSEVPCIGRNPVYISTFAIFVILSVAASLCSSFAGFIVIRFLQGFFGSPCLATGAATLSDMFSVIKIPYSLAAWSGAMYAGPALGPVLSGFAVTAENWRWSMWEIVWLSGFVFVLLFAFLPETSTPTLLYYKVQRLRTDTGSPDFVSKSSSNTSSLTRGQIIKLALVKPFEITLKDPAIAFTNFYTSLTYGIYYSFFEVFPLVYPKIYGMNTGETGAVFICVLIACIMGIVWYCTWYRMFTEPRFKRLGTFDVQETFLRPGLVAIFGFPIGMLLFGWAARESVPWPVPTLGIVIVCGCSFVVGIGIFLHLPLSYPEYAASLFAANDALRSSFATAAILFGRPLYSNLGIGQGCTLLGCLSIFGIIGLWYLYFHGEKLRQRSKFTAQKQVSEATG